MEGHGRVTDINVISQDVPSSGLLPGDGQRLQEEDPHQHDPSSSAREATDINVNVGSATGTVFLATTDAGLATSTDTLGLRDVKHKHEMEEIITTFSEEEVRQRGLEFREQEGEQQAPVLEQSQSLSLQESHSQSRSLSPAVDPVSQTQPHSHRVVVPISGSDGPNIIPFPPLLAPAAPEAPAAKSSSSSSNTLPFPSHPPSDGRLESELLYSKLQSHIQSFSSEESTVPSVFDSIGAAPGSLNQSKDFFSSAATSSATNPQLLLKVPVPLSAAASGSGSISGLGASESAGVAGAVAATLRLASSSTPPPQHTLLPSPSLSTLSATPPRRSRTPSSFSPTPSPFASKPPSRVTSPSPGLSNHNFSATPSTSTFISSPSGSGTSSAASTVRASRRPRSSPASTPVPGSRSSSPPIAGHLPLSNGSGPTSSSKHTVHTVAASFLTHSVHSGTAAAAVPLSPSPNLLPPSLPVRSPLRPPTRSISSFTTPSPSSPLPPAVVVNGLTYTPSIPRSEVVENDVFGDLKGDEMLNFSSSRFGSAGPSQGQGQSTSRSMISASTASHVQVQGQLPPGQLGHGQAPSAGALPSYISSSFNGISSGTGGFTSPSPNSLSQPQPQSQSYHVTTSSSSQHNNNSAVTSSTIPTTTTSVTTSTSSFSTSTSTPKSKSSTSLVSPSLPGVGGSASNTPSGSGSNKPHSQPPSSLTSESAVPPIPSSTSHSTSSQSPSSHFRPVPPPLSASISTSSSVTIATTTSSASTLTRSTSGASTEGGEYQRVLRSPSFKSQQQAQQQQQHFNPGSSYQNHPYQQQASSPNPYQQQPHSPIRRSHSLSHSHSQPSPLSQLQQQQQQRHKHTPSVQSTGSIHSHNVHGNGNSNDAEFNFEDLAQAVREAMPSHFRPHANSNASSTASTPGHGGHGYSGGYERERDRGEREQQRGYERGAGYERMGERGVERERERDRERKYSQNGGGRFRQGQGQVYDDGRGYDQRGVPSGGGHASGHPYAQAATPYAPPNQNQIGSSQGQRQSGNTATHNNSHNAAVNGNRPSSFPGSAESHGDVRPDSPLEGQGRPQKSQNGQQVNGDGQSSPTRPKQAPMTKRQHALHELLSSERAYASDLALLRDLHIPMALGQTAALQFMPVSPPSSSASSSRTVSTASDSSVNPANANGNANVAGATANGITTSGASSSPPMTVEDTKVIFSNILEIAIFSDNFSIQLEEALGNLIDGGKGDDRVGSLFLKVIPELERPYKYYITRHPTALTHLQNLPQTPAFQTYIAQTQQIATALTHAWDLASFLIKPVQRLLKYPLLLAAIIDETPDGHPDKDNLRDARSRMEEVARNVNEGRRRAEVVKEVLSGGSSGLNGANGGANGKKKGGNGVAVGVGVAASVNLSKMKNIKALTGNGNAQIAEVEGNEEVLKVEKMQAELKCIDVFAQQFAKNVVDWGKGMAVMVRALRNWALSFGKVIGLSPENGSDAFDAFISVVEQHLMSLTVELEAQINERLLKDLAHLLSTMTQPFKLLNSMNEQQPFHYHLLTMTVSAKNRPPASLLAASTNYLALRGQLAAELPTYINLLHTGLSTFVTRLADIQAVFWCRVRDKWGELWEMLRVEGEMNAGGEETMYVWSMRWGEVEKFIEELMISQQPMKVFPTGAAKNARMSSSSGGTTENYHPSHAPPPPPSYQSYQQSPPSRKANNPIANVLSSLDPSLPATPLPSSSSSISVRTSSTRARGSSDASLNGPHRRGRRNSVESLRSGSIPAPPAYQQLAFPHPYANQPYQQQQGQQSGYFRPSHSPPRSPNAPGAGPSSGMGRRKTMDEIPLSANGSEIFVGGGYIAVTNAVPTQSMLPRTKSMPSAVGKSKSSGSRNGGQSEFGETDTIRARPSSSATPDDKDKDRGRSQRKPSLKRKLTEAIRPSSSGQRRSSSKPLASPTNAEFFIPSQTAPPTPSNPSTQQQSSDNGTLRAHHGHSNSVSSTNSNGTRADPNATIRPRRDSWEHKSAKYICHVTYPCVPPAHVSYYSFPFFTLQVGEIYEVLKEAGHPSVHPKLPVYVDEGEDCLLLCRDEFGRVGWAFASFLQPVGMERGGEGGG